MAQWLHPALQHSFSHNEANLLGCIMVLNNNTRNRAVIQQKWNNATYTEYNKSGLIQFSFVGLITRSVAKEKGDSARIVMKKSFNMFFNHLNIF
jgi:hypothetical protein